MNHNQPSKKTKVLETMKICVSVVKNTRDHCPTLLTSPFVILRKKISDSKEHKGRDLAKEISKPASSFTDVCKSFYITILLRPSVHDA
jgi:hypothetical protein